MIIGTASAPTALMPSRADIDPVDLPSFLPGIVMVDVGLRAVSPSPIAWSARARRKRAATIPTGKSVFDNWDGRSQEDVLENYRLVIEKQVRAVRRRPHAWIPSATGWKPEPSSCRCPMTGETVNKILIYTEYKDRQGERLRLLDHFGKTRFDHVVFGVLRLCSRARRSSSRHSNRSA